MNDVEKHQLAIRAVVAKRKLSRKAKAHAVFAARANGFRVFGAGHPFKSEVAPDELPPQSKMRPTTEMVDGAVKK